MSRFLFTLPPLRGHVNPALGVAAELLERGHEVAWIGVPEIGVPEGARLFPYTWEDSGDFLNLQGIANMEFLWERFVIPLGDRLMPLAGRACDEIDPHLMIADQHAIAGPATARRRGLPWATSAAAPAGVSGALDGLPKVQEWIRDLMNRFQLSHGIEDPVDLRFSPHLVIVYALREMMPGTYPDHYLFAGTSTSGRQEASSTFPWGWLSPGRRHVLVSLGSLNGPAGGRFFEVLGSVARRMPDVQFVCVAPEGAFDPPPDNLLASPWVPQVALMPSMDAIVCHGGANTVYEALDNGLPLVVAAIRHDQPVMARQVAGAGAGIQVRFNRLREQELFDAVEEALHNPSYRTAAQRMQRALRRAGGPAAAADRLEQVLTARTGGRP